MNLFTVTKKNPFWPLGSWVQRFSDGVEKCIVGTEKGRMTIDGYEGLIIPYNECESFLMRVQIHGLDAGSVRMDRRKRVDSHGDDEALIEEEAVQELVDSVHERKLWPAKGGH